jgi:hypothetical protein
MHGEETSRPQMVNPICADEPAPQGLLAQPGQWNGAPAAERSADLHLARGKAYRLLGYNAAAEAEFHAALAYDADFSEAYDGLARLRLPGEDYLAWLAKLHSTLRPSIYLEIGVDRGRSLALAKPPTRAIGVDPSPRIDETFKADTRLFRETSDAFFSDARLGARLDGSVPDLVFIDGLHLFEQTLKDFVNVEAHAGRHTVVLLHDTIPVDETTQRRAQSTTFYTGDVWKTALGLKQYRPDLEVCTIATPPTGLTVVTGLDCSSRILADRFDEMVEHLMQLPYAAVEKHLSHELNIIPNDWSAFEARLKARLSTLSTAD